MLMSKGFITPSALHYVRNHGAVPKLDWNTHRISVGGMVDRPATFSIPELLELLPSYTIPVTLVCAGVAAPPQRNQLEHSLAPGLEIRLSTGRQPPEGGLLVCLEATQVPAGNTMTRMTLVFSPLTEAFTC